MGEVYRARDPRLDREVAVKVLPEVSSADETARLRLLREARMAARLNHPGICTIHEVGEAGGQAYIAMELVAGQTLSERLAARRMGAEEVVRVGRQIADAVAHAHERGVVHRDLKAANVIVTPDGRAKVLDFGLAKPLLGKDLEAATTLTQGSLTEAGAVIGTLAYMAPEQLRGQPADARSDVWALGVVLYEMAAGTRPFAGSTGYELSSAILSQPPRSLTGTVPPALAAIIERCLAKEPDRRYQRAGEVCSALETMQQGTAPAAWPGWRASLISQRWPVMAAVLSSVLLIVVGLDVGGVRSRVLGGGKGTKAIRLAVLPFANLSGDPEQEYLSDGLTQEMIAQLGRLHPETLSVIARTSVMRYKDGTTPVDRIGRELKVDYVLEGSARREGSRVRISAELIHTGDQTQLWSDVFEREMSGILALQNEVARKVADSLALELLPSERARLAQARAVDPEVHDAYLRGSVHLINIAPGELDIAERYFDAALEKNPAYAPAHAGRARAWSIRGALGLASLEESGPKVRAAALKAIALDEGLSAAHEALAWVRWMLEWDWRGARESFLRAIELNPNDGFAQANYGWLLLTLGHREEGLARIERAVALDPFNPLSHAWHAAFLSFLWRNDEAIATAREALRLQADHPIALGALWSAYGQKGMEREALEAAKKTVGVYWDDPKVQAALEEGFARGGYAGAMRALADAVVLLPPSAPFVPADVANYYAMAGEKEKAIDWLEKAYEARNYMMVYTGCDPVYRDLHPDPRFQALLRKMNLPLQPLPGTLRPSGAVQ
jgi:TolB-like protein/Tfp pilus assembly protein PilF